MQIPLPTFLYVNSKKIGIISSKWEHLYYKIKYAKYSNSFQTIQRKTILIEALENDFIAFFKPKIIA